MQIFFDNRNLTKCCEGVTFGQGGTVTSNSSGAKWQGVRNQWGRLLDMSANKGRHTVKLTRRGPLPHLVAVRPDTAEAFGDSWQPPQYKVRDLDSVPVAHRKAFQPPTNVDVAALRQPAKEAPKAKPKGKFEIPAWTFDRGNARIYASPDLYADAGPIVGADPKRSEAGVLEYDIDFPVTAEYTLQVSYAAAEARPLEVFVDGKPMGRICTGIAFGTAPFETPVQFTWNSSGAAKTWEKLSRRGKFVTMAVTQGKHTLKLARRGPLPHLVTLRLESSEAFGKDWKQPSRKVKHLDSVPPRERTAFLPPDGVNVAALKLAIADMIATLGAKYPDGPKYLRKLSELAAKPDDNADALKALRREAMLAHPALKFGRLLFLKRSSGGYGHTYSDQTGNDVGGNLCVLSPVVAEGKVTPLVPQLDGGLFDRFDLSFDARKVVFGYKKKDKPFRIYEIDIDPAKGVMVPGSLRQLTFSSDNEAEALRCNASQGRKSDRGFNDMDPCYLPNGKILFTSTRSMRNVFCAGATVTTLHRMDADGKNMRCVSAGPINETAPGVLDDGRIVYTRWEYVDKGLGNGAGLWAIRPDGSGSDHIYKNNTVRPAGMSNARSIPGSRQIVTVGGTHHNTAIGPVILVDRPLSRRGTEAMTCITPEIGYPCMGHPITNLGFFMDPYPFSEKFFLVAHSPGGKRRGRSGYGIYALDAWGNRAELCRDPELSCFQPVPLRPRRRPMQIAPVRKADPKAAKTATLFVQDVYEGMTGIQRGRVKYLRVMGVLPWPWDQRGMNTVGMNVDVHRKKVYGVVKVHKDGSAYFSVPADENIFLHALDEDYMAVQNMPTFLNLMPGEKRSCIGCHEPRRKAPSVARGRPEALRHSPQALMPQPGETGPRMVHYAADVQPALDKHCVGCHSGENPKSGLDLTGQVTGRWNRSYENLVGKCLVSYRDCRYGRAGYRPLAPLKSGSHLSTLVDRIRKAPCKAKLTRAEFVRIVTWIDANVPYYGTYRGKKSMEYKDHPDFRLPPLAGK